MLFLLLLMCSRGFLFLSVCVCVSVCIYYLTARFVLENEEEEKSCIFPKVRLSKELLGEMRR
jgi:hypothetical protein